KSIKAAAWSNSDNADLTINATSIGSLVSAGNFDPNLDLSGTGTNAPTLGPTKVAGQLNTGFWNITGNVSSVTANAVTSTWGADVAGTLGSFTVKSGGLPADLTATTLNSLHIVGNLTANLTATTVKNIKVAGNVSGSTIYITGDLTSLTAASLVDSILDVGTSTSPVDVTNAVIANIGTSTIGNVTLTSKLANAFSDSSIVAALIKSQSLGAVETNNGGVKEGVAGTFKSFTASFGGVVLHAGAPQLINATTFSNYYASKGLTAASFGDFEVDFVS